MSAPVHISIITDEKAHECTNIRCQRKIPAGEKFTKIHVNMGRGMVKHIRFCGLCSVKLGNNYISEVPDFKEKILEQVI